MQGKQVPTGFDEGPPKRLIQPCMCGTRQSSPAVWLSFGERLCIFYIDLTGYWNWNWK